LVVASVKDMGANSASVEYSVESLEGNHADDKVESFSTGDAEITNNQINSSPMTFRGQIWALGVNPNISSLDKNGLISH
jgi:hypothetical protein